MTLDQTMPTLFIGHGNPMNAIEETPFVAAWREQAASIPRPKAILCVSAHWESDGTQVAAMQSPRTIHDFYGFPDELFRVKYPAPGSPQLAEHVREIVGQNEIASDESWGIDHGAWSVLCRMYPEADIPVIQLSLDRNKSPREHFDLAKKLLSLRKEGVLIIGSGNIVHNLSLIRWNDDTPYQWAIEFSALVTGLVSEGATDNLIDYSSLVSSGLAIPTGEHYLPLLYVLAQQTPDDMITFFADRIVMGSLSMQSLRIG